MIGSGDLLSSTSYVSGKQSFASLSVEAIEKHQKSCLNISPSLSTDGQVKKQIVYKEEFVSTKDKVDLMSTKVISFDKKPFRWL